MSTGGPAHHREVERNEAAAYALLVESAPNVARSGLRLTVAHCCGATVFRAGAQADSLLFNRVIGLGVHESFSAAHLLELDALFSQEGVSSYAVEAVASMPGASSLDPLMALGLVPYRRTTMMSRPTSDPVATKASELSARLAGLRDQPSWVALVRAAFSLDARLDPLLERVFDHPAQRPWVAVAPSGEICAAALTTRIDARSAWIGWVCTRPEWRKRGAQSVMAAAQVAECAAEGIEHVSLEVAGTPERPGTSLRNYMALGWSEVHGRVTLLRRLA